MSVLRGDNLVGRTARKVTANKFHFSCFCIDSSHLTLLGFGAPVYLSDMLVCSSRFAR